MSFWVPDSIVDVVTALGFVGAVGTLYATMRLRRTSVSIEYVKRYWQIADALEEAHDDEQRLLQARRYLTLCDDEFEIAGNGLIDPRMWHLWHAGVRSSFGGTFAQALEKAMIAEPERYARTRSCHDGTANHEAYECPGLKERGQRLPFPLKRMTQYFRRRPHVVVPSAIGEGGQQ